MREVYLDYAAATPLSSAARAAMVPFEEQCFYNPSAPYQPAREARAALEQARAHLASFIGAKPDCVVLTAGATEANNLALATVSPEGHVVSDTIEHESVLACVQVHPHTLVEVSAEGFVSASSVAQALAPQTELVSIELANGEIGTIQPIREIAQVIRDERARRLTAGERRPLWLHVDASQAASTLSVNVSSLGCDLMTLSAAKVSGPKQVGLLWAREGVQLRPLLLGGGQESGVRSGTENVAGAAGFAAALGEAVRLRKDESVRLRTLRDELQQRILAELPAAHVAGPHTVRRRLPGLLHVSFAHVDARRLVIALEQKGVYVGTGSACAASRMQVSHVLTAIGMPEEFARGSLRMTLGRATSADDIAYAAKCLVAAVRKETNR